VLIDGGNKMHFSVGDGGSFETVKRAWYAINFGFLDGEEKSECAKHR
jgi:hypothetical protein